MSTYITIYRDVEGNTFVGEEWVAETDEQFNTARELEYKVLDELAMIQSVSICKVEDKVEREEDVEI